ncbi:hypothetical protein [Desulfovibrio oxyclinae]|uniref:hypothetical protein n=1 Tax=Desulfovibrio oxyclinae TaxID=63560 RepID=UPI0003783CA9|nr:hypothetical protein [Desulfovibrio oxyclinae]
MTPKDSHSCTAGDRFDRIEDWLEKMASQIEKVTELLVETRYNKKALDDHEKRIRVLEKASTRNTMLSKWAERLVWAFVAVAMYLLRSQGV